MANLGNLCCKISQFGKKVVMKNANLGKYAIIQGVTIVKINMINLLKSYLNCSAFSVISKIQGQAKMCICTNVKLISIKNPVFISKS
jgi:hypothetical protein